MIDWGAEDHGSSQFSAKMHFAGVLAHYSDQCESVLMYFNLSRLKTNNPAAKNGHISILLKYDTNYENLVRRLQNEVNHHREMLKIGGLKRNQRPTSLF